jgi:thiol-disulfide isomerase/thioredoxin
MVADKGLAGRWARAGVVAVAVALWPAACAQDQLSRESDPAAEPAKLGFVLKDMAGKDVRLADFKGRPMIVNFWATWCPPCKAEIPGFVELVEKYKAQDFTVLGVSIDDSPADLQRFAAEYKINYPILVGLGHDDLLEAYEASFSVPVSWLVRKDGTIFMKKMGTDTKAWFESQIKALF